LGTRNRIDYKVSCPFEGFNIDDRYPLSFWNMSNWKHARPPYFLWPSGIPMILHDEIDSHCYKLTEQGPWSS